MRCRMVVGGFLGGAGCPELPDYPDGRDVPAKVLGLITEDGERVTSAPHPQQILYAELSAPAEKGDLLRMNGTR